MYDLSARSAVIHADPFRASLGLLIDKYTHYAASGAKANERDEVAFVEGAVYFGAGERRPAAAPTQSSSPRCSRRLGLGLGTAARVPGILSISISQPVWAGRNHRIRVPALPPRVLRRLRQAATLSRSSLVTSPPTIAAFDDPPVSEVVLGLQFEPIPALRAPLIASWEPLRSKFPRWQERAVLRLVQEWFGVRPPPVNLFDVRIGDEPPPVRTWLVTEDETALLQIQEGAFLRNWRRRGENGYPRYSHLRGEFVSDCSTFFALVEAAGLGVPQVTQCEVTYVNKIDLDGVAVEDVMHGWRGGASDDFLPPDDAAQMAMRYTIAGEAGPVGRLHVVGAVDRDNKELRLTLTARGAPTGPTLDEAVAWLDIGRKWVVSGFCSVTTESAKQNLWRRTE